MDEIRIQRLKRDELSLMKDLNVMFGDVFEDAENYHDHKPDDEHVSSFLENDGHIVLVALDHDGKVVAGLVAYVLQKFEMKRSEIYVYDLAVRPEYQRKGIATKLFEKLENIAKEYKTWAIFVQADVEDDGALAFYRSLKTNEIMAHHFEIGIQ